MTISIQAVAGGSVGSAKVSQVRIDYDGRGMVIFDRSLTTYPACVNGGFTNALSFDTTTTGGRSILAVLLTAKATGSSITAYGAGTCNIYPQYTEDWSYGFSQ